MYLWNPQRSRGMPTLSLTGGLVCLCFLLSVLFQPIDVFSGEETKPAIDKKNRVETILHYGEIVVSDRPLPDKVFERRRYTVQIAVLIHEKGKPDEVKAVSTGSGYVHRPGLIISSAHILQVLMFEYIKAAENQPAPASETGKEENPKPNLFMSPLVTSEFHIFGDSELRASNLSFTQLKEKLTALNCEYRILVRVFGRNSGTQVPVVVAAITNPESPKDIMVLRIPNPHDLVEQSKLPPAEFEAVNPAAVLMKPAVTAEAEIGETVYPTGFGAFQPFAEECYVSARPKNGGAYPYQDLKEPYVLRCSPDYGFSGGPTLNYKGEVIGIAKQKTDNFILLISMKDIEDVLKVMDKAEKEAKDKESKDKKDEKK